MPKKVTYEDFVKRANEIHENKYSYINSIYVDSNTKLTINCTIHGNFDQKPYSHLSGVGCPKCAILENSLSRSFSQEEFVEKCRLKHGDKYDYSKVNYTNIKNNVEIICSEHGSFKQRPDRHCEGAGCPKCGKITKATNLRSTRILLGRHVLLEKNVQDKTGVCSVCGPVKIIIISTSSEKINLQCSISYELSRKTTNRYPTAKRVAKYRDISFDLTKDEYYEAISFPCYYCDNELDKKVEYGCGLDRLDSNKGYIKDNVVACCNICNILKSNIFSPEETKIMVKALLEFRKIN